jgi:hypothetical protein
MWVMASSRRVLVWTDYAGLDVRGRSWLQSVWGTNQLCHRKRRTLLWRTRERAVAAERGAVGIISLQTPLSEKSIAFALARRYVHWVSMTWLDAEGKPGREFPSIRQRAGLSLPASENLWLPRARSSTTLIGRCQRQAATGAFGFWCDGSDGRKTSGHNSPAAMWWA